MRRLATARSEVTLPDAEWRRGALHADEKCDSAPRVDRWRDQAVPLSLIQLPGSTVFEVRSACAVRLACNEHFQSKIRVGTLFPGQPF